MEKRMLEIKSCKSCHFFDEMGGFCWMTNKPTGFRPDEEFVGFPDSCPLPKSE